MGKSIYYGQKSHVAYSTTDTLDVKTEVVDDPLNITDITLIDSTLKKTDLTRLAQIDNLMVTLSPNAEEVIYPFSYHKINKVDIRIGKQRVVDLRYTIVRNAEVLLDHNDLLNTFLQPVLPWSVTKLSIYGSQIFDTLDLSNLEMRGDINISDNDFLEGIIFKSTIGHAYMTLLNLNNNLQLKYIDFKTLHGMLTPAGSRIDIRNIGADVDEMDKMLEEANLRLFAGNSGRVIDMSGNAAPSVFGIVFKNKILAKGIEIITA